MTSEQLYQLVLDRQWTALTAIVVFSALKLWKWAKPAVWDRIPGWARVAIPLLSIGLTGFTESLQEGVTWGPAALSGALAALGTIGAHHVTKIKRISAGVRPDDAEPPTLRSAGVAAATMVLLLTGCSALTGQQAQDAQQAVDTAAALCSNTLLRSDTPKMLIDSGVLPEVVGDVVNNACAVLAASKPGVDALLEQAQQQRTTPARVLTVEAQRRGLL